MDEDIELLRLFEQDAEQAITCLIRRYSGLIRTIVAAKLQGSGSAEDIEECMSDVILHFYQNFNKVDLSKGSVKAYLAAIARNESVSCLRRLSRTKSEPLPEDWTDSRTDLFASERERRMDLIASVDRLPEPDREIIWRRYFLGERVNALAKRFNMSENAMQLRIMRALKKLRNWLEDDQ